MTTLTGKVTYNKEKCDIWYTHADDFSQLPDASIQKAHAVCFYNGKVLLVHHPEWNIWGLPRGTRDTGETIEQTLIREIQEETNCTVQKMIPISYQKVTTPMQEVHYRVQYLCSVEPLGTFTQDPAGNINKIHWIEPQEVKNLIEQREIQQDLVARALAVAKDFKLY